MPWLALVAGLGMAAAEQAPVFHLEDVDGNAFNLGEHLGREILLVDFWATFCAPCLVELDTYRDLQIRYRDQGLKILAVSVDQPQTMSRVRSFVQARAFPFPVLLDPEQQTYRLYGVSVMPTAVLIDRQGRIAYRKEGFEPGDEKELERRITELLDVRDSTRAPAESVSVESSTQEVDSSKREIPKAQYHCPMHPQIIRDNPGICPVCGMALVPMATTVTIPAQGWLDHLSLSGSNFLRADYGKERRDLPRPNGWLEDWFDFRLAGDQLSYQARFRAYQFLRDLPDSRDNAIRNPTERVVKQTFAYASDHADLRAGNFYGTLNRGLVMRTFEDRQARIDKDVKGAWASLRGGDASATLGRGRVSVFGGNTFSSFTDLYAMDAEEDQLRNVYLQGLEGEWAPRAGMTLGAQYLEAFRQNWHVKLAGGDWEQLWGPASLYLGYAYLTGQDQFNYPNDFHGRALYGALSGNLGRLELGVEGKYYYNYDLGFTDPPNLVKYHTFRLMGRDMLFPNNQREEGLQAHGTWNFPNEDFYTLNVTRLVSHPERNPVLLIHHVDLPYLDLDQNWQFSRSDRSRFLLDLDWNHQRKFKEGSFEDINAVTLGATATRPLRGPWNVQGEFELQRRYTDFDSLIPSDPIAGKLGEVGGVYSRDNPWQGVVSATLGRSAWTFTLDYEATTSNVERDANSFHYRLGGITNGWASAYFTLSALAGNQISLWYGQRKERVVCSGGSCRLEPAFEGTELIWITHF